MDSGNTSGSMQSSSGGDEEYESRAAESISALLSNNPQNDAVHHPHQSSMFDPLSNFFDPVSSSARPGLNPNPLLNLDMVWPKHVRSAPNSSDLVTLIPSSSQPNFNNNIDFGQRSLVAGGASNFPALQISPEIQTRSQIFPPQHGPSPSSSSADRNDVVNIAPNGGPARNPKKRSRASRRAPTTVLTTDTTNFRAMVQEFTGIPAPPFTSSPFPRTRLDLFGSGSGIRSSPLDPLHHPLPTTGGPYNLLRPFAQKINQQTTPPFVNGTSTSLSSPPPPPTTTTSSNASINAQNTSLLNLQNNPVLSFHSLLPNAPMKFPKIGSTSVSAVLEQDQFGLSHGHHVNVNANISSNPPSQLGGLQNPPITTTTATTASWGTSTDHGMGSNDDNNGNGGNNNSNAHEGLFLRSINGGYATNTTTATATMASNGHKMNYTASSSTDFHGSKTEINVAARSEGMVESWICSSD